MRLAFMGTPEFSVTALDTLIKAGHEIAAVYSQPPRKSGRGKKETPTPVHKFAADLGLPVFTPTSLKGAEEQAQFAALNLDAAVVVAYGLILPQAILDAPQFGCFNIHASLLPRWRGAAPIQRAIMAGDTETGVAIMQMDAGLDTGAVALEARLPIAADDTYATLHDKLAPLGADAMVNVLQKITETGTAPALTAQSDEGVTYAHKIDKAEAAINWSQPADQIAAQIRGLSPFPGAWTMVVQDGADPIRLKLLHATAIDDNSDTAPGFVLDDQLTVKCGVGAVAISRAQRPGKGPMATQDMLRGLPIPSGTKLG